MARIRSTNSKPELAVRSMLHGLGYRFRIHVRTLPGSPDIVFPGRRKLIFVHGCFWHGHENCKVANVPKSRTSYWTTKFEANKRRDQEQRRRLEADGWQVLVIWECELKASQSLAHALITFLGPPKQAS